MNNELQLFKSCLGPTLERYLELKQSLGRGYAVEFKVFKHLDSFLLREHTDLNAGTLDLPRKNGHASYAT